MVISSLTSKGTRTPLTLVLTDVSPKMTNRIDELLDVADRIAKGEVPEFQHNECFTSGAFDLLLVNAQGPGAFELLSGLCERFEAVRGSSNDMSGYYMLLFQVARLSGTTEMPTGMKEIVAADPVLSRELREWYRWQG